MRGGNCRCWVAQAAVNDLELPRSWSDRSALPSLVYAVPGIEPTALCLLGRHSTIPIEPQPSPFLVQLKMQVSVGQPALSTTFLSLCEVPLTHQGHPSSPMTPSPGRGPSPAQLLGLSQRTGNVFFLSLPPPLSPRKKQLDRVYRSACLQSVVPTVSCALAHFSHASLGPDGRFA